MAEGISCAGCVCCMKQFFMSEKGVQDGDDTSTPFYHSKSLLPVAALSETTASSPGPHREQMQATDSPLSSS